MRARLAADNGAAASSTLCGVSRHREGPERSLHGPRAVGGRRLGGDRGPGRRESSRSPPSPRTAPRAPPTRGVSLASAAPSETEPATPAEAEAAAAEGPAGSVIRPQRGPVLVKASTGRVGIGTGSRSAHRGGGAGDRAGEGHGHGLGGEPPQPHQRRWLRLVARHADVRRAGLRDPQRGQPAQHRRHSLDRSGVRRLPRPPGGSEHRRVAVDEQHRDVALGPVAPGRRRPDQGGRQRHRVPAGQGVHLGSLRDLGDAAAQGGRGDRVGRLHPHAHQPRQVPPAARTNLDVPRRALQPGHGRSRQHGAGPRPARPGAGRWRHELPPQPGRVDRGRQDDLLPATSTSRTRA